MEEEIVFLYDVNLPRNSGKIVQNLGMRTIDKKVSPNYVVSAHAAIHRVDFSGEIKFLYSGGISIYDSKPSENPKDPNRLTLLRHGEIWIAKTPYFRKFMPFEEFQHLVLRAKPNPQGSQPDTQMQENNIQARHLEAIIRGYDALDAKKADELSRRLRDEYYAGQADAEHNSGVING